MESTGSPQGIWDSRWTPGGVHHNLWGSVTYREIAPTPLSLSLKQTHTMVKNYTADLRQTVWSLQLLGLSHHSQSWSGNTSFQEWGSASTPWSQHFSPPSLTTKPQLPSLISTSPLVEGNLQNLCNPMEIGPSHGIPPLLPSSALSHTVPLSSNNTPIHP